MNIRLSLVFAVLTHFGMPSHLAAEIVILAKTGHVAPDGERTYSTFTVPAINNQGRVLFVAHLSGSSGGNELIALAKVGSPIQKVGRKGDPLPGGAQGTFQELISTSIPYPAVAPNSSLVVFYADLNGTPNGSADDKGLFGWTAPGSGELARKGSSAFGGGTFQPDYTESPSVNSSSQVGMAVLLYGNSGQAAIYRIDLLSTNPLVEIVRDGESAPGGSGGTFNVSSFATPAMNDSGLVVFNAPISGSGTSLDEGIFTSDGPFKTSIARRGDTVAGITNLHNFSNPCLNNLGHVSFYASWTDGGGRFGILRRQSGLISVIARSGDLLPDGDELGSIGTSSAMNDSGQVVFAADTTKATGAGGAKHALFLGDEATITKITRKDDPVPAGDAVFRSLGHGTATVAINASGQVACRIGINVSGTNETALFLFTPGHGLTEIVRTSDALDGSTITNLDFAGTPINGNYLPDSNSGLNDAGEVAFRYELVNGNQGIAVWRTPLPVIGSAELVGIQFIVSGSGGPTNATYSLVTSTNLASPLSEWAPLQTNFFNSTGEFSCTNEIMPGIHQQFFRLFVP